MRFSICEFRLRIRPRQTKSANCVRSPIGQAGRSCTSTRITVFRAPRAKTNGRRLMRSHKAAARREFEVVMAWSVDRLGRSLQDLVGFLSELHAAGVDLFLHQQGLDTTTPAGKAMFQMLGVFAEFERSIIQERVRAGLRRAISEGKQLGRPRIAAEMESRILAALKARKDTGDSVRKIAARFGVDPSTVQRISRPFGENAAA